MRDRGVHALKATAVLIAAAAISIGVWIALFLFVLGWVLPDVHLFGAD